MKADGRRRGVRMSAPARITTVFFVNGALFASWVSRIPALSERERVRRGGAASLAGHAALR
jgi:hypothetical protein